MAAKGKIGEAKADICEDCFGGAKDAFSLTDWGTIYKKSKSDREFKEIARNASLVKRGEKERDFNTAGVSSTVEVGMRCVRYLKFDTEASFRAENDGFTLDDIRAPRVTIQDERSHKVSGFASEHPVLPGSAPIVDPSAPLHQLLNEPIGSRSRVSPTPPPGCHHLCATQPITTLCPTTATSSHAPSFWFSPVLLPRRQAACSRSIARCHRTAKRSSCQRICACGASRLRKCKSG